MMIEKRRELQANQAREPQPFRIRLESSNVDFLNWFLGTKLESLEKTINISRSDATVDGLMRGAVTTYTRLMNSFKQTLPTNGQDNGEEYGVDYQDFLDFAAEVETYNLRWPPLLRNLIELNDAFVEAGAISHDARNCWQQTVDHVESDFDIWVKNDPGVLADCKKNGRNNSKTKPA